MTHPASVNWQDARYLLQGSPAQREAYQALQSSRVFQYLSSFAPVLAGTIPLDLGVDGSDLDVICHASDLDEFAAVVRQHYEQVPDFQLTRSVIRGQASVIANFTWKAWPFELFAQAILPQQQHAYRHMLIEHRLLVERGATLRQQVIALKQQGWKTEPAFAHLLKLEGDPYEALLKLEERG